MKSRISQWPALSVRISPEVHARIEAEAEQRELTTSIIVREALAKAFGPNLKRSFRDRQASNASALDAIDRPRTLSEIK